MPRGRRPNTIEDFWRNVDVRGDDECWSWKKCRSRKNGYGQFSINGKRDLSHRIAMSTVAHIPEGSCVLHSCDNPGCCNPAHLSVGSQADNMKDKCEKGRQHRPIGAGHPSAKLTESEVLFIKNSDIKRKTLAEIFQVHPRTILEIKMGRTWGHLK